MSKMNKVKISNTTYNRLEVEAQKKGKTIDELVEQKLGYNMQFEKTTKDGVLRRTYYYQKKRYNDVPQLKKFLKRWNKSVRFKEIWKEYAAMDFDDMYSPTFFRHGDDTHVDKLYVARRGDVRYEKDLLDIQWESE